MTTTNPNDTTTVPMFFRGGDPAPARKPEELTAAGSFHWTEYRRESCRRCGGAGGWKGWPGFTCYECGGACKMTYHYTMRSWTAAKLAAMNKAEKTKREKAIAKAEVARLLLVSAAAPALKTFNEILPIIKPAIDRSFNKTEGILHDLGNILDGYSDTPNDLEELLARWLTPNRLAVLVKIAEGMKASAALMANAPDLATGRYELTGTVLSVKEVESMYGRTLKMTVALADGNRVFGTVPSSIAVEKGSIVTLTATVERSDSDPHFGFFSRPTKATSNTTEA